MSRNHPDISRWRQARRSQAGTTGARASPSRSRPSLAKRTVAMSSTASSPISPIRSRPTPQIKIRRPHRPGSAGADPARRRARDGGSGAGAVAGHAGDHRPRDRERLLLRLRQAGAVPSRRSRQDRSEDARDHRRRTRPSRRRSGAASRPRSSSGSKGENFKVELVDAIPEGEELKIYKQGEWLDLCRGPHMTSTGQVGKAFKLQKIAGAYWRGDPNKPHAAAHLRHGLGDRGRA